MREFGVDADIDLYHSSDRHVDWTRYGTLAIDRVDTTIIAISRAWANRWRGVNPPTSGAGAVREADALHGRFDAHQGTFQMSVKIVILPGASKADIPDDLRRVTCYVIKDFTQESMAELLRTLHDSPRILQPPVGPKPLLPTVEERSRPTVNIAVDEGWRALESPIAVATTQLDDGRRGEQLATLELQLYFAKAARHASQ